jgi:oligopeptide/dipeptide ABC transporter ATP-binding protein
VALDRVDRRRRAAEGVLEVDGLRTQIRMRSSTVTPVDGVSLAVAPGETVGLVGESGCGKSMTAMSIMRLLPPGGRIVGGTVRLAGRDLTALSEREMRQVRGNEVGMIFQDPMTSLNPTKTVGEQIAETVRLHRNATRRAAEARAAEMLDLVGVPKPSERLRTYPHHLSGGLRQRVVIAIALACEPKVLIADEPTTALDVTVQDQILSLLEDLKTRLGMGVLLITHDMGVIAEHADRVLVMYAGEIVEACGTSGLFREMRHPYTQALLESIPELHREGRRTLYSIPGRPPSLSRSFAECRFADRCRYARQRCRDESPKLEGDEGHRYRCFFPVHGASVSTGAGELAAEDAAPGRKLPRIGESPSPLLRLVDVNKEFAITRGLLQRRVGSVKAVSGVTLEVAKGETLGLVGESGCGKSTLARLIVALESPDSGTIHFDGDDLSALRGGALRRRRRDLQLVFQDPYSSLDPRMRVSSILREPLVAQRIGSRTEQRARVRELLDQVGLAPAATGLYPHEFSGGQRQRIALARALTVSPSLVVADEPVSALDVSIQSQVLNLMKRLQKEHDLTYIVISHDLPAVRYLADRVGVMYLGKLVEIGPIAEIYERPAHPYTVGLLEAVPSTDHAGKRRDRQASVRGELPSAADPPSGCRFRTRCPRAEAICAEQEPVLRSFNVTSHQAACHFPLQQPLESG